MPELLEPTLDKVQEHDASRQHATEHWCDKRTHAQAFEKLHLVSPQGTNPVRNGLHLHFDGWPGLKLALRKENEDASITACQLATRTLLDIMA